MMAGTYIPDPDRAHKAALRAIKAGRTFKTGCELCGWFGDSSELIMGVYRDGKGGDRFCPSCDGWGEWKLWDEDQSP